MTTLTSAGVPANNAGRCPPTNVPNTKNHHRCNAPMSSTTTRLLPLLLFLLCCPSLLSSLAKATTAEASEASLLTSPPVPSTTTHHSSSSSSSSTELLDRSSSSSSPQEYSIAGLFSLTYPDGRVAQWGVDARDAALLALQHVAEGDLLGGGDGLSMSRFRDEACNPVGAVDKVSALLDGPEGEQLLAIVGADCSGVVTATNNLTSSRQMPVLSYGSGSPELSSPSTYPFFLRTIPSDDLGTSTLVAVAAHFGVKRLAVIHTSDPFGAGGAKVIHDYATRKGIAVMASESFDRGSPPAVVVARMRKLNESGCSFILISAPVPETKAVFEAAAALRMTGANYAYLSTEIVGEETFSSPTAMEAALGYLAVMPSISSSPTTQAKHERFLKAFRDTFHREDVDQWAPFGYDTIMTIVEAIKLWKKEHTHSTTITTERRRRKEWMETLRRVSFEGVTGPVSFLPGTNDRNGIDFDVFNLQQQQPSEHPPRFVRVGVMDGRDGSLRMEDERVIWGGGSRRPPSPSFWSPPLHPSLLSLDERKKRMI
ncbi:hypothetical protein QOT17_017887 [Balamuthia mandrillaris]